MNGIEAIEKRIKRIPRGKPFFAETPFSKNAGKINKSVLRKLVKKGIIVRVSRGIYVRPQKTKFFKKGHTLMLGVHEVIQLISKKTGEIITVSGFTALNYVGLSTQIPVNPVYYTTGRSRVIKMVRGANIVLRHINKNKIVMSGTIVCIVVIALWENGIREICPLIIQKIHGRLTADEYAEVLKNLDQIPLWMREAFIKYQGMKAGDPRLEEPLDWYYQG